MYQLLGESKNVSIIGVWANHTGKYTEDIGYTILGSIILYSPETMEYLILHPRMAGNNSKQYGKFDSTSAFEQAILKDPGFHSSCISPLTDQEVEEIANRLGNPSDEESSYPCPDPAIGGSSKPETFGKGNVWISADISGQKRVLE